MADRTRAGQGVRVFIAVLVVLSCSLAPHLLRLPTWLIAWCLLFWTYAAVGRIRGRSMPGGKLLALLALGGIAAVVLSVGLGNLFELGLAALVVLLGLKPMEMRSHRDRMVTVYMSLFLVLGSVYYTESLLATAYVGFMVVLLLATLVELTRRRGVRWGAAPVSTRAPSTDTVRTSLSMAVRLLLMAAPLAVVLFLVFPRLPQGLMGYEAGARGAGFGSEMEPGSLSGYALDDTLDFRVRFEGPVVPTHLQYWRARTLVFFDGRAWHTMEPQPLGGTSSFAGATATYTVLLEPRTDRILPVLDTVVEVESDLSAGVHADWSVRANGDLRMRHSYTATSAPEADVPRVQGYMDEAVFLQLPAGNPRARELASQWQSLEPAERVMRGLTYLREGSFTYTLEPPPPGLQDTVDRFLFETRAGFCEHFASAFAFLMRAAGVPARVVIGYQGGEYNELDDYLMVRRLNAHAWVEMLLPGRGWIRADPTGAAAPERIGEGALQALNPWRDSPLRRLIELQGVRQVVAFTQMAWDMVSFRWQTWVLGYDFHRQISFLSRLGVDFTSLRGKVIVLIATLLCLALAGAAYHRVWDRPKRQAPDRAVALYRQFGRKLAGVGLAHESHVPPEAYADSVTRARPDLASTVHEITALYLRERYGPDDGGGAERLAEMERLVRGFDPRSEGHGSLRS